jgi:hypothetical protein
MLKKTRTLENHKGAAPKFKIVKAMSIRISLSRSWS